MNNSMTLKEIWDAIKQINENPFPKKKVIAKSFDKIIASLKNKTIVQVAKQIYFSEYMFCKIHDNKGDEKRLQFYDNFQQILKSGTLVPKDKSRKMSKVAKAYLNERARMDEQSIHAKMAKM